ncbi:908_t:CDS:2 [Funneliformis geosporum]|uniref:908_t:CDS:1 n=1 Tax=Funneliformis geosporum TaxID=1117311 RepID=A0A9W4SUG2_9GLOM|nr:908_t:CDS:2 [Funneliformis geosporum]
MPLAKGEYFSCSKYKLFICYNCFWDWYARKGFWKVIPDEKSSCNTSIAITKVSEPLEERFEKFSLVNSMIKKRKFMAQTQMLYTGQKIGIDINMVVFTHMNALAKDFQNDHKVKAQTWYSFFRWNDVGEYILEIFINYLLEQKCQVICYGNDAQPLPFFGEMPHNWLKEQADYYEKAKRWTQTNCLVPIFGSSKKKELVKNDIIHLPLNTLLDKFLKDMLADKKVIDWELGYAMTIYTSQGMTLKASQSVWVIDENLVWDNLIYLAIEEAKKNRQLEHELKPSIQEKLIRYMG